jgi:cytoskeleton protein RodZ
VETEIGPTLREARIRRKIDLADVEQRIKIRVRYLRALENEEWDVLPGDTYARSFIRTYANFLSLDGDRLADDFRQMRADAAAVEGHSRAEPVGLAPRPRAGGGGLPSLGTGATAALISIALIAVLVAIFALSGGEDGGGSTTASNPKAGRGGKDAQQGKSGQKAAPRRASLELAASGEVWVCVLDASGSRLVNGQILAPGATEGPFHSGKFDISFGNGAISMRVNGRQFQVPESASPLGYEISEGKVNPLTESERPTCE